MKKIIFIITFAIVSCKTSYTKIGDKNANYIPYYLKVYEFDSLYYAGNYFQYKKEMKKLFKKYEPINTTSYWEFEKFLKASILVNKNENFNKEIKTLIVDFGYSNNEIFKDSTLSIALKTSKFSDNFLKKLENKYTSSLDNELIVMLNKLEFNDQEIRQRQGLSLSEREPLMKQVDQKNDSIVKNYFISKGFPSKKIIRDFSFGLLFNHFSYNGSYEFYKKELPKYVKNGTCDPRNYAMLIDRWHLINNGEPYYYNTWFDKIKAVEKDSLKIIEINERRLKDGLPSINQEKIVFERMPKLSN